jgi:hypothetical protein
MTNGFPGKGQEAYAVVFPRDVVVSQGLGGDVLGVDLCVHRDMRVEWRQRASGGGCCGCFPGGFGLFVGLLLVHDVVDLGLCEAGLRQFLSHRFVQLGLGFLLLAVFFFLLFFALALELLPLTLLTFFGFSLLALDFLHNPLLFFFGLSLLAFHPFQDSDLLCFGLLFGLSRFALHPLQDANLLCFRFLSGFALLALVFLDDPLLLGIVSLIVRSPLGLVFQALDLNLRLYAGLFTLPSLTLLDIALLTLETLQLVLVELAPAMSTIAGARTGVTVTTAA